MSKMRYVSGHLECSFRPAMTCAGNSIIQNDETESESRNGIRIAYFVDAN
jgi:hypothetical protein